MAEIDFHITHAGAATGGGARIRESMRMCALAYCMRILGHRVNICGGHKSVIDDPRWRMFSGMWHPAREGAITVRPTHEDQMAADVIFKTDMKCENDKVLMAQCTILVAHNFAPEIADSDRLLDVPLMIHDEVMKALHERSLFGAYMRNSVHLIRDVIASTSTAKCKHTMDVGFCGEDRYDRRAMAGLLRESYPGAMDIRFTNIDDPGKPRMATMEYLAWLSRLAASLDLPGERDKTYRFAESVVMGTPIVTTQKTRRDGVSPQNAIVLDDWSDADSLIDGLFRRESIQREATTEYELSWSPMGQARRVLELLGV